MGDVFVQPSGQDDNLGDSALRRGLLSALRIEGSRLHVHLDGQTSDYLTGIPLLESDVFYPARIDWLDASRRVRRPVYALNAGEINPHARQRYPRPAQAREMRRILDRGGVVVAAGLGLKDPDRGAVFDPVLRRAHILSWRDRGSRDAVGEGEVAPDWAFALGPHSSCWAPASDRRWITVTLRFDRPWPDESWFRAVRSFSSEMNTTIVTVAQVARDAPRAVQLASELGGRYLVAPSMSHDDLDRHVRAVYAKSLAVISDRAHALIMGATEGAAPLGSAAEPQKILRILDAAGIGGLSGRHNSFAERAAALDSLDIGLPRAIDSARAMLGSLTERIRAVVAEGA